MPLGGNGYTAPFSAYSVIGFTSTGIAGGGFLRMAIEMDPRFCALVSFFNAGIQQATPTTADVRLSLAGPKVPSQNLNLVVDDISSTVAGENISATFNPTPVVLPGGHKGASVPRIFARMANVEDDTFQMNALIYLFDIRVRELTPMGPLLWARGAT